MAILFVIFFVAPTFIFFQVIANVSFKNKESVLPETKNKKPLSASLIRKNYQYCFNKLNEEYKYFQNLPDHLKAEFAKRVQLFIRGKQFVGRDGLVITSEMKVLVAAAAVHISFGLKYYTFKKFKLIVLYPEVYYNSRTDQYYKGLVLSTGAISLSWKFFQEGYQNPYDKINLGLHEMAHALDLSGKILQDRHHYIKDFIEKYRVTAAEVFNELKSTKEHFFRDYAKTNMREFFSVAVEHFFEAPDEFKKKLPELYVQMCLYLNQDPSNNIVRGVNLKEYFHEKNESNYKKVLRRNNSVDTGFINKNFVFNSILELLPILAVSFTLYYFIIESTSLTTIALIISYFLCYLIYAHIKLRRIVLNENYFHIIHPYSHKYSKSISYKNIISVNFYRKVIIKKIVIVYIDEDSLRTIEFCLFSNTWTKRKIQKILIQKNILVKSYGLILKKKFSNRI